MNKIILLGIITAMMGIIILPETLALFSGQHSWYNIKDGLSDGSYNYGVPCTKCHADIAQEFFNSVQYAPHSQQTCESCHIITEIMSGGNINGTSEVHASTSPECMDCHGNNNQYAGAPKATSIINGKNESHINFVKNSENSSLLKGANEACIGCHTHVQINITWKKPTTLNFDVDMTNGKYVVNNFTTSGINKINTSGI